MKALTQLASALVVCALAISSTTSLFADGGPEQEHDAKRDHLRAKAQGICPVSGKPLGSMGQPVKVAVGEQKEQIFLCCKACAQGQLNPQHWATIHSNIVKAQGKCPVMQKSLPASPKWTIVEGQIVYICCPPCTKKIAADPETYLSRVDGYYSEALK